MGKELQNVVNFEDNNGQQWDIGVYEIEGGGNGRFSTEIRSPEGEYYRPEDDFFGDLKLIDKNGKAHGEDLPLNMDALQEVVEKVEAQSWRGQTVPSRVADGQLSHDEQARFDDIAKNFDKTAPETEQSQPKAGWAQRIQDKLQAKANGKEEISR